MKARLVPLFFDPGRDDDFDKQLAALKSLLAEHVELLEPVPLGARLPEAEAVVFPQLLGEAYRQVTAVRAIRVPILLVTSEFGTLSMWDWEIAEYFRSHGIETIGPYSLEQTRRSAPRWRPSANCGPPNSWSIKTILGKDSRRPFSSGFTGGKRSARTAWRRSSASPSRRRASARWEPRPKRFRTRKPTRCSVA